MQNIIGTFCCYWCLSCVLIQAAKMRLEMLPGTWPDICGSSKSDPVNMKSEFALGHHLLQFLPLGVTDSTAVWLSHIERSNKYAKEILHHYCYVDWCYVDDTPNSIILNWQSTFQIFFFLTAASMKYLVMTHAWARHGAEQMLKEEYM